MTLDDIKQEINDAEHIIILTHEYPDGDAIGSSLAMYNALCQMGKDVDVVIPNYPKTFDFLPGVDKIKSEGRKDFTYDLGIALDCADTKRLKGYEEFYENSKVKISIDHHGTNTMYADYNYVDPVSPACTQILIVLLASIGVEINKDIGTCILTGLLTDTGGFRYSGVSTETFEIAARILRLGVNISDVCRRVLQVKTKAHFELTKIIIDRMEFLENGKIAFTYMTLEDEERLNVKPGDHEGIVEIGRDIENVEVSIFLREVENGFKVSLRSNEYVNVAEACSIFGGGGHLRAAGCTIHFPLEQTKEKVVDRVKSFLEE